jgi:hypothetical protein
VLGAGRKTIEKEGPPGEPYTHTAIMYETWQAHQADRAKYMPQTIEPAGETMVADLDRYAEDTGRFDHQLAHHHLNYLQANYAASTIDELGSPISRSDVTTSSGATMRPEETLDLAKRLAEPSTIFAPMSSEASRIVSSPV